MCATRGWEHATPMDTRHRRAMPAKAAASPATKRSKYGAVKTQVDGITFDSKAEARRYVELTLLKRKGLIRQLVLQPSYPLDVSGVESRPVGIYRADFSYWTCIEGGIWTQVIEDVKGFKTPLYRWKKKHVKAQYGITITEIR